MFNSLKYAKQLVEAGFSREQAEAQMEIMADLLETKLAMKEDVTALRDEMIHRFELMDKKFERLELVVHHDVRVLEKQMTIKLGIICATVTPLSLGIVTGIFKFFI